MAWRWVGVKVMVAGLGRREAGGLLLSINHCEESDDEGESKDNGCLPGLRQSWATRGR